jgi:hypothetical protein
MIMENDFSAIQPPPPYVDLRVCRVPRSSVVVFSTFSVAD